MEYKIKYTKEKIEYIELIRNVIAKTLYHKYVRLYLVLKKKKIEGKGKKKNWKERGWFI